jgi:hypothetical protein
MPRSHRIETRTCVHCKHKEEKTVIDCYCDDEFDGSGYTYSDEYGDCDHCIEAFTCSQCGKNMSY